MWRLWILDFRFRTTNTCTCTHKRRYFTWCHCKRPYCRLASPTKKSLKSRHRSWQRACGAHTLERILNEIIWLRALKCPSSIGKYRDQVEMCFSGKRTPLGEAAFREYSDTIAALCGTVRSPWQAESLPCANNPQIKECPAHSLSSTYVQCQDADASACLSTLHPSVGQFLLISEKPGNPYHVVAMRITVSLKDAKNHQRLQMFVCVCILN